MELTSRLFFSSVASKTGIYFITNENVSNIPRTKRIRVKIGSAEDLAKRLDSYFLYWPKGYYLLAYITVIPYKKRVVTTERFIQQYLTFKRRYLCTSHSHDEEWFHLSKIEIDKLLLLLEMNKGTKYTVPTDKLLFYYNKIRNFTTIPHFLCSCRNLSSNKVKALNSKIVALVEKNTNQIISMDDSKPKKRHICPGKTRSNTLKYNHKNKRVRLK
jgi:hypothetical protein